jgi:nitrate reductase NapE component
MVMGYWLLVIEAEGGAFGFFCCWMLQIVDNQVVKTN